MIPYLKNVVIVLLVVALAVFAGISTANLGPMTLMFGFVAVMLVIAITKLDTDKLIILYFVSEVLAHTAKRAIFLVIPNLTLYYIILVTPLMILAVTSLIWFSSPKNRRMPEGGWFLAGFILIAVLATLTTPAAENHIPWSQRLQAMSQLLCFSLFYMGNTMRSSSIKQLSRIVMVILVASLIYGIIQFVGGPTIIDRTWSNYMAGRSLQATKLFRHTVNDAYEFRPHSLFADSLQWGMFLAFAFAILRYTQGLDSAKSNRTLNALLTVSIAAGLLLTLSRSPWIAFLMTPVFTFLIRKKICVTVTHIMAFLFIFFIIAVFLAPTLSEVNLDESRLQQSVVAERYSTLGTLEARVITKDIIKKTLSKHWLLGTGLAVPSFLDPLSHTRLDIVRQHVSLIGLAAGTGLPGLFLFVAFFIKCVHKALNKIECDMRNCINPNETWLLGLVCGYMVMGYFSGMNWINSYYFLSLGILVGHKRLDRKENTKKK